MAATPFDPSHPDNSFAFEIYNDANSLRASAPSLPGGPCNYTDQTLPRCGCRRFWSRALFNRGFQDNTPPNLVEVCMCSHHACFHEDAQPGQAQSMATASAGGQENQKPVTHREPLSPIQDFAALHMPPSFASLDLARLDFQTSFSAPRVDATAAPRQVEDARPEQESPLPDTFNSWGEMLRTQAAHNGGIPPIPPQCLMSPQPPSTASSSQARYLMPFSGKGLQTLSSARAQKSDLRRSIQGEPDTRPEANQEPQQLVTPDPTSGRDSTLRAAHSQAQSALSADSGGAYQKLAEKVETHEQRLDRIERASFSVAGHEDCHDKHEHIDLRVTELESRVDEVEKMLHDNASTVGGRRTVRQDGTADDATASVVSVSTNATVLAPNRAEVYNQLQALQAQVDQLQAAALPTYSKPWNLEVVFLPFPLKGIWMSAREFPSQRRSVGPGADEWTQMPNTVSRSTPDPQSPKFQEWPGQGPESNWLLPRAFVSGRIIDQRLKSRGLIKTVSVRGADARSVQLAIHDAFEDILRISSNASARAAYPPDWAHGEFLALRHPWVPLRKIHKDSRLRFLTPAEMATPALWNFTFLFSSVVMKATGVQRLYITQPEAYLQDHPLGHHAFESGWTWQKLRQLSRVYPDSQSSANEVPEADAMEACWAWDDRLDEPPSVSASSVSLRQSHHLQRASRRSSTEPSQQFYTGVQSPALSSNPGFVRGQSPLVQRERKGSWPPRLRTGSVPPASPALLSPAQSRRRVSSHAASATPYERRSSPFVPRSSPRPSPRLGSVAGHGGVPKRRFRTRSPSLAPRTNTPRWSRSPSLAPGGPYGYHPHHHHHHHDADAAARGQRHTTPFYYATPHSEALPDAPYGYHRAGSRGPLPGAAMLRTTNGYDPDDDDDEDMRDYPFDEYDDDDDADCDDDDEELGGTESYDSEMMATGDGRRHGGSGKRGGRMNKSGSGSNNHHGSSFGFGATDADDDDDDDDDADSDIDVYEDEEEDDELDGVDTDVGPPANGRRTAGHGRRQSNSAGTPWHGFGRQVVGSSPQPPSQQALRPEDIPWAGIEDAEEEMDMGEGEEKEDEREEEEEEEEEEDSLMSDGENVDPRFSNPHPRLRSQGIGVGGNGEAEEEEMRIHRDEPDDDVEIVRREQGRENDDDGSGSSSGSSSQAPSEYSSRRPGAWQIVSAAGAGAGGVGGSLPGPMASSSGGVAQKQQQQKQQQQKEEEEEQLLLQGGPMEFKIHEDGTAGGGQGGAKLEEEGAGELLDTQWG
ncbi:hypothetical protein VTK26DRAFT_4096 [Humicola hyalothermophila]